MKNLKSMNLKGIFIIAALGAITVLAACKKKPTPVPTLPQEEIQSVKVVLTKLNVDLSPTTDVTTVDYDVKGTPTPSSIDLEGGKTYRMQMIIKGPGNSDVNAEIMEEGTEHRFFFLADPSNGVTNYTYNDADVNARGIGLDGNITIGTVNTNLSIVLRHALDKSKPSAQDYNSNNYENAGGEDDLRITLRFKAL